jgi:hypothetical protein
MSRRFTGTTLTNLHVGTPPDDVSHTTLSRKVQSELNLSRLTGLNTAESIANSSLTSEFSGGAGDALPDEMSPATSDMTVDCDAIIALREVSQLVRTTFKVPADIMFSHPAARCSCCATQGPRYL